MRPSNRLLLLISVITLTTMYSACRRHNMQPPSPTPTYAIEGKWSINTVTTTAYDVNGQPVFGPPQVYTPPAGTFFEFAANGRWTESLSPDLQPFVTMRGTYTVASDTRFTYSDSLGNHTDCIVDSLTTNLFVFEHTKNTQFNGVTPGSIRYVFRMTR